MRTIGLLGGMSWVSTAEYYRMLNQLAHDERGGLHSAPLLLRSFDFAEIAALQAAGRWDDAGHLLADAAKGLEAAGAELLLIGTNTMHKVAPAVQAAVSIPLLHIIDATAERVTAAGLTTVGLLGSSFTMQDGFYQQRMHAHGLHVLIPGEADRQVVHRCHLRRADRRRDHRRVQARLPGDHRPAGHGRRRGRDPGLHRDRAAHRPGRQPGPGLPDDPDPRRSGDRRRHRHGQPGAPTMSATNGQE